MADFLDFLDGGMTSAVATVDTVLNSYPEYKAVKSFGVEDLLGAIGVGNQKLARDSQTVAGILQQSLTAQQAQLDARGTERDAAGVVIKARELADVKAQADTLKMATALGTNPDASTEIMTQLATAWRVNTVDAEKKRAVVAEKMATKFLEDPIKYIKDNITLESSAAEADYATRHVAAIGNELQQAQSLTQNFAVTSNALKQSKSAVTVQAALEEASAKVDGELARTKVQNAGINIAGIQALDQMTIQQINMLGTGVSAQNQAEQLKMARANFGLQKQSLELAMQDRLDRLQQRKLSEQEQEDMAGMVRAGASALGFSDAVAIPTTKVMQLLKYEPTYTEYLRAGMRSVGRPAPVISDNAGSVAKLVVQSSVPLQPAQEGIREFLKEEWSAAATGTVMITPDGKKHPYDNTKVDQVTGAVTLSANMKALGQLNNIKDEKSNIYRPPSLPDVLAIPGIAASPLAQKVFLPQNQAGGLKEFNPEQIISLTVKAVKDGTVSYNDAREGLQGMFKAVPISNNRNRNYVGLGLPPQVGYRTQVENGLGFLRSVDLSTPQDIDTILNSRLSGQVRNTRSIIDARPFGGY